MVWSDTVKSYFQNEEPSCVHDYRVEKDSDGSITVVCRKCGFVYNHQLEVG